MPADQSEKELSLVICKMVEHCFIQFHQLYPHTSVGMRCARYSAYVSKANEKENTCRIVERQKLVLHIY